VVPVVPLSCVIDREITSGKSMSSAEYSCSVLDCSSLSFYYPQLSGDAGGIPTGFRLKAQGCEARATLGKPQGKGFNPDGVASLSRRAGHNPVGVEPFRGPRPRVARASQPWAERRNPFGIPRKVVGNAKSPLPLFPGAWGARSKVSLGLISRPRPKHQPPSRRSGAMARRGGGGTGAVQKPRQKDFSETLT